MIFLLGLSTSFLFIGKPERKWNRQMHELIREMLHYRNGIGEGEELDPVRVSEMETRYDGILELAQKEYEDDPPGKYYREGYNMFVRLKKYKESELLFLHDRRVPANNSLCERLARVFKRKQRQATAAILIIAGVGVKSNKVTI